MTELWRLSASEITQKIAAGDLTCEAVTAACLERIKDREPEVDAWIYLDKGKALADAAVGEQVLVENLRSARTIKATVTGPGRVEVPM